jgi:hypothetical protein
MSAGRITRIRKRLLATMAATALSVIGLLGLAAPAAHALGTGQACIFNAPLGADGLGHIGWGFQIAGSSTWVYGSSENPNGDTIIEPNGSGAYTGLTVGGSTGPTTFGFWQRQGTMAQMMSDFQTMPNYNKSTGKGIWNSWPAASLDAATHAMNQYTRYKCISVTNTNVTNAVNAANAVGNCNASPHPGECYILTGGISGTLSGWNCMDHAYYILEQYNAGNLLPDPSTIFPSTYAPNSWFTKINASQYGGVGGQQYSVTGTDSSGLADFTGGPAGNGGSFDHYIANNTPLIVVCQTRLGAQEDGRTQYGRAFTTWDQLDDGSFVYDWYMNTPVVQTNGYSTGIHSCVGDNAGV